MQAQSSERPASLGPTAGSSLDVSAPWLLLQSLRPKQWSKNALVFAALVFTYNLRNESMLATSVAAFAIFCMLSSAGYLLNDVFDISADRLHPVKRLRPVASGHLSLGVAALLSFTLAIGGIGLAFWLRPNFGLVAGMYVLLTVVYSLWLKHLVLIDVFSISAGFVLRAAGGAAAIGVPVSPWLYVCTVLGSLLLALGKRRNELELLSGSARSHRKNLQQYSLELVDQLVVIVASATIMAYSLYTFSAEHLPRDHSMMLTIPLVLYGIFRYLYLIRVKRQGGAPEDMLLSDPGLLCTVLGWAALSIAILYVAPH